MSFAPQSCDTFVVMPFCSKDGLMVFGKNSDRPSGEVQSLFHAKDRGNKKDDVVKCTYIEIDEVARVHSILVSKPIWMWGAEMGANERGVCIGNEAIWTNIEADGTKKLLGMDLVRLALERASTARKALDIITNLLEKHGQGGSCSDDLPNYCYHNSFLIADGTEAWVLETAGSMWVAEQVVTGYRHISNCLSIGTNFDLESDNIGENALKLGLWDGTGEFNFKKSFERAGSDNSRIEKGKPLLNQLTAGGSFDLEDMFKVLRDCESGICRGLDHPHPTAGSMASVLFPFEKAHLNLHCFTGTPDPRSSIFKPFYFTPTVQFSHQTTDLPDRLYPAPEEYLEELPANAGRLTKLLLERILAYVEHREHIPKLRQKLRDLETERIEIALKLRPIVEFKQETRVIDMLFKESALLELKIYEAKSIRGSRGMRDENGEKVSEDRPWFTDNCLKASKAIKKLHNKEHRNINKGLKKDCEENQELRREIRCLKSVFVLTQREFVTSLLKSRTFVF